MKLERVLLQLLRRPPIIVSIPLRGSEVGKPQRKLMEIVMLRFPSPYGEVKLESRNCGNAVPNSVTVSIPLRGSEVGKEFLQLLTTASTTVSIPLRGSEVGKQITETETSVQTDRVSIPLRGSEVGKLKCWKKTIFKIVGFHPLTGK